MASTPVPVPMSSTRRGRRASQCGRARAGSRGWCRDGRCRRQAPPRSRCRCGSADAGAVMRAVHDEAAGLDRGQALEALAYPVGGRERLEQQVLRRHGSGQGRDPRPYRRFVGSIAEMQRDRPAAVRLLERRGRDLVGIEDSASTSAIFRPVCALAVNRATTVVEGAGEGSGIAQIFPLIPNIHRRPSTASDHEFTARSTAYRGLMQTIMHSFAGWSSSACSRLPWPDLPCTQSCPSAATSPRRREEARFRSQEPNTKGWTPDPDFIFAASRRGLAFVAASVSGRRLRASRGLQKNRAARNPDQECMSKSS